jgi:hypothetical protein
VYNGHLLSPPLPAFVPSDYSVDTQAWDNLVAQVLSEPAYKVRTGKLAATEGLKQALYNELRSAMSVMLGIQLKVEVAMPTIKRWLGEPNFDKSD